MYIKTGSFLIDLQNKGWCDFVNRHLELCQKYITTAIAEKAKLKQSNVNLL